MFFSFNMSLGVNLLVNLAKKAAQVLGRPVRHRNCGKAPHQKIDAPSGTALMIADAIQETMGGNMVYQYDRHAQRKKREHNEIGIHSVRGGTIVGEHQVIFAGRDEVVTLTHEAHSKQVFAVGAVNAAVFLERKPPASTTWALCWRKRNKFSDCRKSQTKVFGAAFYKKLLGLQGAKPLHRNCFFKLFLPPCSLKKLWKQQTGICRPKAQSRGRVNPETPKSFFDKLKFFLP